MTKLLMMYGLPGSGKTTQAKELEKEGTHVRVNKDDIRKEYFPDWTRKNEKEVIYIEDSEIIAELREGNNVVVDDTNLHPKHETRLKKIAADEGAEFESMFIDTPLEICIRRNNKRDRPVPLEAIISMYNKYIAPIKEKHVEYDDNLDEAIVVDIDGTLAHIDSDNGRSPYDASRAMEDRLDDAVSVISSLCYQHGYRVIILTGRHSGHLGVTKEWLAEKQVDYDEIYCREEEDTRPDWIVKEELFDEHIRDKYNVKFVIDDRPSVCRMWRSLGLKVLQVGEPHVEF